MDFKAGDRVRDIVTGDEGLISSDHDGNVKMAGSSVFVDWVTGLCSGLQLTIGINEIEHCCGAKDKEISLEEALTTLLEMGYTVSLTKAK